MSVVAEVELVTGLPDGWTSRKLGEVCRLWNGRAYKKEELLDQGRYVVLRVGNFFTNDRWYYSDLELEAEKYCDDGDLLYAWSASFGPRIWAGGKVIYHYHIWKITLEDELIDKDFLFHFLDWDAAQIKSSMGSGSTMIHVTKGAMEQRAISLPPLDEQRRIAEVLRSVDDAIAAADGVARQAQVLWHSLTESLIWQLQTASPASTRPLGDAVQSSDYGVNAPLDIEPAGYAVLRMGNLQDGWIDRTDLKWGEIADREAQALALDVGDILFNRTNSRDLVGKVALVREPTDDLYASYIVRLRVNRAVAAPHYLFAVMHSRRAQAQFKSIATPGVSQSNINPTNLKKQLIPLPSLSQQQDIAAQLEAVEGARRSALEQLSIMQQIKADLMSDLLSGRVRVPA
ncbi:restriction endonuclease subunit S [Novosphingobium sp.]|uniref:restriction endonuclease subunit S n=1 Tax=Novosphingobium sp. TaxID=1874826 RepID=UPI0038B80232